MLKCSGDISLAKGHANMMMKIKCENMQNNTGGFCFNLIESFPFLLHVPAFKPAALLIFPFW